MDKKKDGGAAFPVAMSEQTSTNQYCAPFQEGMSLRDYFAAQMLPKIGVGWPNMENRDSLATQAYQMADAMIEARKK